MGINRLLDYWTFRLLEKRKRKIMEYTNYIPKEISWLSFNERVLQEAENKEVPLFEKIKFLGIYSSNLDEFYRVRVATLKRISKLEDSSDLILGYNAKEVLIQINKTVLEQRKRFDSIYQQILKELASENIFIIDENRLGEEQAQFVMQYFRKQIKPHLMPVMVNQSREFPTIKDEANYFVIRLKNSTTEACEFAIMELPQKNISRFLRLPDEGNKIFYIVLDDIVRYGLRDIFYLLDYDQIDAFSLKLTKDAELDIADDISESYIQNVAKGLKRRKDGNPVSIVFDKNLPEEFIALMFKKLHFKKQDAIIPGGKYHNLKDLIAFPHPPNPTLKYENLIPIEHKDISPHKTILEAISKKDILLHFPYHSFNYFLSLMQEAAIDPRVTNIKFSIYRLAKNSVVVNALINAARNGKSVTVVIELQARFDEEANIKWSNRLKDEGVKVIYGVPGLKVHAKLLQITREENGKIVNYAAISTGNFNENTAGVYSDLMLLTADRKIASEVVKTYNFLEKNYKQENFNHLVLSPFHMRNTLVKLINNEIEQAKRGEKAYIHLKVNNLVAPRIIQQLYEASAAGVEIKLIVRGMMSLVAGKKGLSENIEARGVVDRFLEHSRIILFGNGGKELVFISSADWMARSIDRRVEVTCPVYDEEIKKYLHELFDIQWNDNVKNRILDEKLSNGFVQKSMIENHSQTQIYEHLKEIHG